MNDGEQIALTPDEQTGLMAVAVDDGETNISIHFPAEITIGMCIQLLRTALLEVVLERRAASPWFDSHPPRPVELCV